MTPLSWLWSLCSQCLEALHNVLLFPRDIDDNCVGAIHVVPTHTFCINHTTLSYDVVEASLLPGMRGEYIEIISWMIYTTFYRKVNICLTNNISHFTLVGRVFSEYFYFLLSNYKGDYLSNKNDSVPISLIKKHKYEVIYFSICVSFITSC